MTQPVCAAVVGTGFIGPVHVEAIRRLGHTVRGIVASTPEKAKQAAATLHLEVPYFNFEAMLADPLVRVVHVASPNRWHAMQCEQAIAAGKHVICEKPLGMTSTETAKLLTLSNAANTITAVNYNIRFYPAVLEVRERVRQGTLGRLFHVVGSYLQDWLSHADDFNWRVLASEGGASRAVADIGTHLIDTLSFMSGQKVVSVLADFQTVHPVRFRPCGPTETFSQNSTVEREAVSIDTEDAANILVRFDGGLRASLAVSQVMAGKKNALSFELAGEHQAASWNSEEPNTLHIGHRYKPNECIVRDPNLLQPTVRPYANYPGGHAEGFPDTFKQLYRAVYADIQAVEAGHAPTLPEDRLYASFADGHTESLVCEAILASQQHRQWIDLA